MPTATAAIFNPRICRFLSRPGAVAPVRSVPLAILPDFRPRAERVEPTEDLR